MTSWISSSSFWIHFIGAALLIVGCILVVKREVPGVHGIDKIVPFGKVFFAVPMAVFGMQHFSSPSFVAQVVPSWMPWHLFWVYFVGTALIASTLSIITGVQARLAALLLGLMLFLFVAMLHVPNVVHSAFNRFAVAAALRDLAFGGSILAFAGALPWHGQSRVAHALITLGRFLFAIAMIVFGVEHLLHPGFAPGVPLEKEMPSWIPGHLLWSYLTGAALVVSGLCIVFNKRARLAATWLGIVLLLLVWFVYLPMEIAHPSAEISGELDYLVDTLALSGSALLIAEALRERDIRRQTADGQAEQSEAAAMTQSR